MAHIFLPKLFPRTYSGIRFARNFVSDEFYEISWHESYVAKHDLPRIQHQIICGDIQRQTLRETSIITCDRRRNEDMAKKQTINFSGCDFLGLASHSELNQIDAAAILKYGRNESGYHMDGVASDLETLPVNQFETKAAQWLGCEYCLLVNSGTLATMTCLQLSTKKTYTPKYIHKTMMTIHAHRVWTHMHPRCFSFDSPGDLLNLIKEQGPGICCVESVCGLTGTLAPMEKIVDICNSNSCTLIVDESNAIGVFGEEGEGVVKAMNLEQYVPFRTSCLSKAFGAEGGLITFSKEVAEGKALLTPSTRAQNSLAQRLVATLDIIKQDTWRRDELTRKSQMFRYGCQSLGFDQSPPSNWDTPIVSFVIGTQELAQQIYQALRDHQIYPHFYGYPATPINKSLIQFFLSLSTTNEDIHKTLAFLRDKYVEFKPWMWPEW